VDLADYRITSTVSKSFRTHGRLVLEEKGYILNTDSHVGEAVLKGRFIGKIMAKRTLELHSSATIKGTLKAGCLVVPTGQVFRWAGPLEPGGAVIEGEFVGTLRSAGTVTLKSTARFFGELKAGALVMEAGAVFVGTAQSGGTAP
jgi:cytoskeletal protein CcmA (bactofilin family)